MTDHEKKEKKFLLALQEYLESFRPGERKKACNKISSLCGIIAKDLEEVQRQKEEHQQKGISR